MTLCHAGYILYFFHTCLCPLQPLQSFKSKLCDGSMTSTFLLTKLCFCLIVVKPLSFKFYIFMMCLDKLPIHRQQVLVTNEFSLPKTFSIFRASLLPNQQCSWIKFKKSFFKIMKSLSHLPQSVGCYTGSHFPTNL